MDLVQEVLQAEIEIAKEAAGRWKAQTEIRNENRKKLKSKGVVAVEDPEQIARYRALANAAALMPAERIIGDDDRKTQPENEQERKAGIPVARIVKIMGDGISPVGFGTGFMVSPDLLLTNNHVLPSRRSVSGIGANFGYDFVKDGGGAVQNGDVYELDDDFYVTDRLLDYTLVRVKRRSLSGKDLTEQGFHPLIQFKGKILRGKPVNIIQHPMGGGKKYATSGNELVDLLPDFLHYRTDTEPGASGSPVFSEFWETVALHHSGVPKMRDGKIIDVFDKPWDGKVADDVDWVSNEGVRISKILADLKLKPMANDAQTKLRDALFAAGRAEAPVSPGGSGLPPAIITTKESRVAGPVPQGAGAAQTVINVYGNAEIYTGTVSQVVATPPAEAAGSAESFADAGGLEKVMVFDTNYGRRRGYQAKFLDCHEVGLPQVDAGRMAELHLDRHGNPMVLDYHHYSLVMNARWMMPMLAAVNVDFSPDVRWDMGRKDFGSDKWIHDPRIAESQQIDNEELYKPAKKFDKGHVVRRVDSAWGVTREEVVFANSDTFHWTNCTPQHEAFNRSNRQGIWGKLENHIADQAGAVDNRLILFSGPVLDEARSIPHDFGGGTFRVPYDFWKVVIVAEAGAKDKPSELRAYAFLLEQKTAIDTKGLESLPVEERFDVGEFEPQQVTLRALQKLTGLKFSTNVLKADTKAGNAEGSSQKLESLDRVKLRP